MPGPVSDSYDPEFGTGENCSRINAALREVYADVSEILGNRDPLFILNLIDLALPEKIPATLTERQWRIIRFALERSQETI